MYQTISSESLRTLWGNAGWILWQLDGLIMNGIKATGNLERRNKLELQIVTPQISRYK